MDVRGCTKGKGGGWQRRGRTAGGQRRRHRMCHVWRIRVERRWMGGFGREGDTTQQQYDTIMTKQRAQNTQIKIIEYTNNTQTPWAQREVKIEQEGARPGEAEVEAKSLVIRNQKEEGDSWRGGGSVL